MMTPTTRLLVEIGVGAAIVWMGVMAYCAIMIARSFWSGVRIADDMRRLLLAWYQDWFDATFEEAAGGQEGQPEARGEAAGVKIVKDTTLARSSVQAPAQKSPVVSAPPGAARPSARDVFVRRPRN
jgi:hypothetical protein